MIGREEYEDVEKNKEYLENNIYKEFKQYK